MKRVFLVIALGISVTLTQCLQAEAGFSFIKKENSEQVQYEKVSKKSINELLEKMDKYSNAHDMENLKALYNQYFVDNDGYNKDVYFSLVKDTWKTYPDITYKTKVKDIKLNGDYATVETEESASATSDDLDRHIIGELNSTSKCIYHLQKFANKWAIVSEQVIDETSTLKYGDARYIKMDLEAPKMIGAGQEYTATLRVEAPDDVVVAASINQERIVNPATKPEEQYMKLRNDGTLSRIFVSNTDNINEYNVASVGITKGVNDVNDNLRVFVSGLAFVMSRVNVVPVNNFARVDDKSETEEDKNEQ